MKSGLSWTFYAVQLTGCIGVLWAMRFEAGASSVTDSIAWISMVLLTPGFWVAGFVATGVHASTALHGAPLLLLIVAVNSATWVLVAYCYRRLRQNTK